MMIVRVWIATVLLGLSLEGLAQESITQETNAPSVKWYQINTPHFKLLYPKGFEVQAQRVANTMEQIREPEAASMGTLPRRIPIILQNQSSISNGFVTLAPWRSEFFTMPSQNYNFVGTNDWINLLASHEYRHVAQFQRSITGFSRFIYGLFGQQAQAGLAFAAAPQWFWEGDAVATETAFTHSGRGRIPNFDLVFRTNLLEGRTFNYHKQYLRSFKNNIPNHYVLGYHMVSYLRQKTGDPLVWEKIAGRSWRMPIVPFAFSNSIKKGTGLYVKDLYKEMAANLTTQWKSEMEDLPLTKSKLVTTRNSEAYTDFLYPQVLEDGSVVAQKSGIGDIEQLVVITPGAKGRRYVQGPMNVTGMMSAAGSKVVWNEYRYDPRWLVRTYSIVKGYDFSSRTTTILQSNTRYASAALSPDGKTVATIETTTDYQTRLVLLDYATGQVTKEIMNPGNDFISMPHWREDGKSLVALKVNKAGKTISVFDASTGESTDLFSANDENVGYPVPFGKYVFYNSPYSGIDNIYALDTETGKRFQVTCSKYASYNPAISRDGKTIYYNEQGRNGMDVVQIPLDPTTWRPIEAVNKGVGTYQHLVEQEGRPTLLDSVPTKVFPTSRYHRSSGMINPHSWGIYFTNPTYSQAQFGIYSQDILSTTSINAGYLYDVNERTGSLQAGVSYQGFYPIIDFQVLKGNRTFDKKVGGNDVRFDWDEVGTSLGLRVPLVLTRSKYVSQIEVGNTVGLTHVTGFEATSTKAGVIVSQGKERYVPVTVKVNNVPTNLDYLITERINDGQLLSNYFQVNWYSYLKQSRRDFNPKFGQALAFEDYRTPYGGDFKGGLWVVRGIAYFPGLIKHHSLFFRGGYQNSVAGANLDTYTFRNRVFKPRGYSYPLDKTFYSFSANYKFPVWYPDIAIGPVLNIQRVKANLFYDYGHSEGTDYFYDFPNQVVYPSPQATNFVSTGLELTLDVNVMRLLQQLELGVRISHTNSNSYNNGGMVYEVLIGNIPF